MHTLVSQKKLARKKKRVLQNTPWCRFPHNPPPPPPCCLCVFGNAIHKVCQYCKILSIGNYVNPNFGPFVEVCDSIIPSKPENLIYYSGWRSEGKEN